MKTLADAVKATQQYWTENPDGGTGAGLASRLRARGFVEPLVVDWFVRVLNTLVEHRFIRRARYAEVAALIASDGATAVGKVLARTVRAMVGEGEFDDLQADLSRVNAQMEKQQLLTQRVAVLDAAQWASDNAPPAHRNLLIQGARRLAKQLTGRVRLINESLEND